VVLEVLDPPIHDGEQESGSTYFREPLGLVVGLFWNRNPHRRDFVAFSCRWASLRALARFINKALG
jgi:hypothetical protein